MKRMTVPAFLVAAVLAFSLAGCSSAQPITEDTLKGVWSLDSGSNLGFSAYLNFGDDSVAEMIVADSWLEGTWAVSGTEATLTFEDLSADVEEEGDEGDEGSSASSSASSSSSAATTVSKLTYSNNKLTLGSSDGSKLVFVKDDSEEAKAMFAFDLDGDMMGQNAEGEAVEYVDEVINPIDPAVVVADDDKFTIKVTGKGTDYTGDPCYTLSITNKTDKAVYVVPEDDFTVGDKKVEAGLGDEVAAGETLETEMYFAQDDLGGGLELLTTVDGVIQVLDDENDDEIAKYTLHIA